MNSIATLRGTFAGKRVFVTGHTGFKGSWLSEWLLSLGAEVWGYSLPPPTKPALFDRLGLARRLHHQIGDVREKKALSRAVRVCRPDFVFHLAAQPIVRFSYVQPVATWDSNVCGTINVPEALRQLSAPCAVVMVTTDKVYADTQVRPHLEGDLLGGGDPYGASKAAAEIAIATWRSSYFSASGSAAIGVARAGNVIGGGDWAKDRLVPDCVRSLRRGLDISIRNPASVRPWQHVLDPLCGYLLLAAELRAMLDSGRGNRRPELCGAFNFGPAKADHRPVCDVVIEILRHWPGRWSLKTEASPSAETAILRLNAGKARRVLGWRPRWRFEESIERTIRWYRDQTPGNALKITLEQIAAYESANP